VIDVQGVIFATAVALAIDATWTEEALPTFEPLPPVETSAPAPARRPLQRPNAGTAYLAASSCLGHDTSYLLEWIEFHRLVGVERFFLYNNGDREAQRELLQPYVDDGVVVLYEWTLFPPQRAAARHCLAAHHEDARWIAFIDTDEFLYSPTGMPLPDLLASYERWPGVGVNEAVFGPSGHHDKPPGLVIENYLNRRADPHIKSIVDPRRAADCVTPHHFTYHDGFAVDENGYPIVGARTSYISFARFRINHYYTKSEAEFRAKLTRRRPDFGAERDANQLAKQIALTEQGELDSDILQFVPALRASLERRRRELKRE
jgi:glycosyl transferase family 92